MNKIKLALALLLFSLFSLAQEFKITTSKISGLWTYAEAASMDVYASAQYSNWIQAQIQTSEKTNFEKATGLFASVRIHEGFEIGNFPNQRTTSYKWIKDLVKLATVHSRDLTDFSTRISGMMTAQKEKKLLKALAALEPFYESHVWNRHKKDAKKMVNKLKKEKDNLNYLFKKALRFYGSEWPTSKPFVVAVHPIPFEVGGTTATPNENALICGFLTGAKNESKNLLSIITHEMCHTFYANQPVQLQYKIDSTFTNSNNQYANFAYHYLDEGLATAFGNGWSHKITTGSLLQKEWYADSIINSFSKSIYPFVESYIETNKTVDSSLIAKLIDVFEQAFPQATSNYSLLFNSTLFMTNVESMEKLSEKTTAFQTLFRARSFQSCFPINDEQSIHYLNQTGQNLFVVLEGEYVKDLELLCNRFPDLKNLELDRDDSYLLSVKDPSTKSTLTLVVLKEKSAFTQALKFCKNNPLKNLEIISL